MIILKEIKKTYQLKKRSVVALDHLSLDIQTGEFVSIIGPSGSGKSTLLLMLGGMLSPTEGDVIIDDLSMYKLPSQERAALRQQKIGFVFQTFHLVPYLTALQNVQLPLLIANENNETQEKRAIELLTKVGLSDRLDHKPSELSVGQQQRVALARTLANDPQIILADEPTGNLDPNRAKQTMEFLKTLHEEGKTIIVVTHDMSIAAQADRTIELQATVDA